METAGVEIREGRKEVLRQELWGVLSCEPGGGDARSVKGEGGKEVREVIQRAVRPCTSGSNERGPIYVTENGEVPRQADAVIVA